MEALITDSKPATSTRADDPPANDDAAGGDVARETVAPDLYHASERVKRTQARLLRDGNRLAALMTLLAAPLLAYLLKDVTPRQSLLTWMVLIVALSTTRFLVLTLYREDRLQHLGTTLLMWSGASGLAWGSTAFLVYPPDSLPQQILLLVVLAGVTSTAVIVHSGVFGAVLAFTLPATLPMIARLAIEGSEIHDQLALLATLFLLTTLLIAYKLHRLTMRGLQVGVDNEHLVSHLQQAKDEADKLNQDLQHEIRVRRDTEARLRQEHDFVSGILDTESAIVIVFDQDARILRFNRACEIATGLLAHEVLGKTPWETLLAEDQAKLFRQHLGAVMNGIFPSECEVQWLSRDRGSRLVQLSNTAILGSDGKCTHIVSTGIDVTERRLAEAILAHTRENFELLVDGVTDYAIYMLDRDGTIVSWNTGAERISGYSAREVIGTHFGNILPPWEAEEREPAVELRIAAVDGQYKREGWYVRRDGNRLWATLTISPVRSPEQELRGFSIIVNDITARKQAEAELAQSRESLRSLSSHLQHVREEEKASLARELHDELGGLLTALKIEISSLKTRVAESPEQVHDSIDAITGTAHEAIAITRRISTSLRPPILDNLGLTAAIEWQLEQFKKRMDMPVDLHISGDTIPLDSEHTIAIFRILQEGLTNIARHAQASRVSVAVTVTEHAIALDIIDDGTGFSVSEHKPDASYGLYSMQERARALGGSVDIISQPDQGTRLKVRVPVTIPGDQASGGQ